MPEFFSSDHLNMIHLQTFLVTPFELNDKMRSLRIGDKNEKKEKQPEKLSFRKVQC